MKFRFIADEPTAEDSLGFGDFIDRIDASILEASSPFVFGLLGPWGSGKTSAQRMLEKRCMDRLRQRLETFEANKQISTGQPLQVAVWFDAWKYENQANMIFPLLHAFRQSREGLLAIASEPGFGETLRQAVIASALSVLDVGLRVSTKAAFGESIKLKDLTDDLTLVDSDKDPVEVALSNWVKGVEGLSAAYASFVVIFAQAVAKRYGVAPEDVRFVVFIDDLDRCLPDVAIAVIEGIKNHLSARGCIYILGLNPAIVEKGIRQKYGSVDMSGREYLEKILNYSFNIPPVLSERIERYGADQLKRLIIDDASDNAIVDAINIFGRALRESSFTNPRKIKRILNSYLYFLASRQNSINRYYLENISRLIIIAEYYPELFLAAANDTSAFDRLRDTLSGNSMTDAFEQKHGVALGAILPELRGMPGLLNFNETPHADRLGFQDHLESVLDLVRRTQ